jgi:ClpP class serine protease
VIAQIPNISKVLKKNDVDMLQFTAGRYKRTVTMLGEVTSEGKRKLQEDLDVIHRAFSDHVGLFRPQLVPRLPEITTGEVWLGRDALALGLVDAVAVASEVVQQATRAGLVIRVKRAVSKPTRLMQWIFGDSDGASAGAVAAAVAALASAVATVVRALAPAGLGLGLGLGVGAGAAGTGAVVGAPHAAALEALALAAAAHPHAHAAVAMPPTAAANFARFA